MNKIGAAEIIVPGKELTEGGLVASIEDGTKAAELFLKENIDALVIGNMNFGMEVAVGEVLSYMRKGIYRSSISAPNQAPFRTRATGLPITGAANL